MRTCACRDRHIPGRSGPSRTVDPSLPSWAVDVCRAVPVYSGAKDGGDVGAELGQGTCLGRALQGRGRRRWSGPTIPAAVSRRAGRRRTRPSRQSPGGIRPAGPLTLLVWRSLDAVRVVAFAPRAHFRAEPGRGEDPGRAAAGRVGGVGVQEVRLQRPRPGRVGRQQFDFHHGPGVLPGNRAGLQSLQGQRQPRDVRASYSPSKANRRLCSLTVRAQATSDTMTNSLDRAVPRGRRRRRQAPGSPWRSPRPAAPSTPPSRLPPGAPGEARPGRHPPNPAADQPTTDQTWRPRSWSRRWTDRRWLRPGAGEYGQLSHRRGDRRQGLPALRTPYRVFDTLRLGRGYDSFDGAGYDHVIVGDGTDQRH